MNKMSIETYEILEKTYNDCIKKHYPTGNYRKYKKEITLIAQVTLEDWKPINNNTKFDKAPFQVLDFFCGCGGMSLGFAALSQIFPFFKIIGGCDIDPDAVETYKLNFKTSAIETDVRLLEKNKLELQNFLISLDGYDKRKPLIAIGCAPCQGFTSHRKKNWDKKDQRNTLVGTFASVAVQLNPECVVMENVPEMLSGKYWNHFEEARTILEDADYLVYKTIYNAASFGVPQDRFRAIVIAMKRDFLLPEPILTPNKYVTVRQAIGNLPKVSPGEIHPDDKLHRCARHRKTTIETIRAVPKNGGKRPEGVGPKCLDRIKGFSDVYGRLYWDRPSITITHYSRNPASGRFVHPEQDRGLTMREAALLQSFPMGFEFKGSFDSIFKQIGEAVPPRLACGIAASVLVELSSYPPKINEKENSFDQIIKPVSNSFSSVIVGLKRAERKNAL